MLLSARSSDTAGIAGMIDIFQGLGQRLLANGYSTPFLYSRPAYMYHDLEEAKRGVKQMGSDIAQHGLPAALNESMVFAFTGTGNVSQGALEIFRLLPHKMLTLDELVELKERPHCSSHKDHGEKRVYGIMVRQEDMVAKKEGAAVGDICDKSQFDSAYYRNNPHEYESIFAQRLAPYCNVIVNGIYWDERYPRLLTKSEIRSLYEGGNNG